MAKTSSIQRNLKRIRMAKKFLKKRQELKKIINNRKETIEQEMNYSIFWPKLLFEYLKNEFKSASNFFDCCEVISLYTSINYIISYP